MSKQYNRKGLYNSYDKNHKEREALDYYSTPIQEVENILETIKLPLMNKTILEPCCGGLHMVKGINNYLQENNIKANILARDIKDRGGEIISNNIKIEYGDDFFDDNYPINEQIDYIIMNPPYSVIEPFLIRALEIPSEGLLMLARLQVLEGKKRYENIFLNNPPSDVYVYIDRISCYKNGIITTNNNAQAYAWFYWNLKDNSKETKLHWIYRKNEVKK